MLAWYAALYPDPASPQQGGDGDWRQWSQTWSDDPDGIGVPSGVERAHLAFQME